MPSSGKLDLDIIRSEEVSTALSENRPVVALESTVISHGLPYPKNIETALAMIGAVRSNKAVPAVTAVLDGRVRVGLSESEIEHLGSTEVRKLSVRDLPIAIAKGLDGATTVATTSLIAHSSGIGVFATGGIGGVHRGNLPDISADLPVLASTPITVVCSGAKAVLDLPATREWLETAGVPLLGLGCRELPAFFGRSSGLNVDEVVSAPFEAAKIIQTRDRIGMKQAVIVAAPVPEADSVDSRELEEWISVAVRESEQKGIAGKNVTPFLLIRLSELSGGRTLKANTSLLVNNAGIAAKIAYELSSESA